MSRPHRHSLGADRNLPEAPPLDVRTLTPAEGAADSAARAEGQQQDPDDEAEQHAVEMEFKECGGCQ